MYCFYKPIGVCTLHLVLKSWWGWLRKTSNLESLRGPQRYRQWTNREKDVLHPSATDMKAWLEWNYLLVQSEKKKSKKLVGTGCSKRQRGYVSNPFTCCQRCRGNRESCYLHLGSSHQVLLKVKNFLCQFVWFLRCTGCAWGVFCLCVQG